MNNPTDWGHRSNRFRYCWISFSILLVLSLLADVFTEHHAHFGFEDFFGFYACYGFGAGIALVIVTKMMGVFLRRKDTYYN